MSTVIYIITDIHYSFKYQNMEKQTVWFWLVVSVAVGVLSELRFKYIKIPVTCVKMLANTPSIRCAFALFTTIFIIFRFFDLKDLYF